MLILRMMVEVDSRDQAEEEMRQVALAIGAIAEVANRQALPYWKIPAFWEITLYLESSDASGAAYDSLRSLAGAGWTDGGGPDERWAVWNPAPDTALLSPNVRWAELQE